MLLLLLRLPRVAVVVVGPLALFATLFSHLFLARGLVVGSAQTPAADATRCLGARTHTHTEQRKSLTESHSDSASVSVYLCQRIVVCNAAD